MVRKIDEKKLDQIREDSFGDSSSFVTQADRWLRDNGIITPVLHNNLIINLYVHFPKAKYVEYFMDPDAGEIEIYLHYTYLNYLFKSEASLERSAKELLSEYLPSYRVRVHKRRFTGPSEGTDESR